MCDFVVAHQNLVSELLNPEQNIVVQSEGSSAVNNVSESFLFDFGIVIQFFGPGDLQLLYRHPLKSQMRGEELLDDPGRITRRTYTSFLV